MLEKGYRKRTLQEIRKKQKAKPSTFNPKYLAGLRRQAAQWQRKTLGKWTRESPERRKEFRNPSNIPIGRLYTPEDIASRDEAEQADFPAKDQYLRGV